MPQNLQSLLFRISSQSLAKAQQTRQATTFQFSEKELAIFAVQAYLVGNRHRAFLDQEISVTRKGYVSTLQRRIEPLVFL